jgi:hypothetical protein
MAKILIADDRQLMRSALKTIFSGRTEISATSLSIPMVAL